MRALVVRLVLALAALGLVGMHALGAAPPAEASAGHTSSTAGVHAVATPEHDDGGAPSHHGGAGSSAVECVLLAGSAAAGLAVVVAALLGLATPGGLGALLARRLALTGAPSRGWLPATGPPVPATACVLRT